MIQNPHPGPDQHRKLITSSESSFAHAYHGSVGAVVQLVEYRTQWRRNLFGKHGQSRTTFSGGTALNVNCRTTFQAHETFNHHVSDSQMSQGQSTSIVWRILLILHSKTLLVICLYTET